MGLFWKHSFGNTLWLEGGCFQHAFAKVMRTGGVICGQSSRQRVRVPGFILCSVIGVLCGLRKAHLVTWLEAPSTRTFIPSCRVSLCHLMSFDIILRSTGAADMLRGTPRIVYRWHKGGAHPEEGTNSRQGWQERDCSVLFEKIKKVFLFSKTHS